MPLLTWTKEEFGTNVGIADDQHITLFGLVNDLHDLAAGSDRSAIGSQLDAVINFVVEHFAMEEKLMQETGYPNYEAHKAEHVKLVNTCADVQKKFHAGEVEVTQDTTHFVKDWLVSHIPNIDQKYGPHLNSNGVA
jgi:hemerythrin